jgi:SPP1 family phage portal protein
MAGIKPIYIPLKAKDLTIDKIMPFMSTIASKFNDNSSKVKHFRRVYENQHAIYGKTRRYEDDSAVNNKIATPNLWAMVNFKSGYALGNPKEYSQNQDMQTDDINYLNKYAKDSKLRTIDKDVATEIYAVGNCYYFIEPKELSVLLNLDLEYQSPFNIYCKPSDTCAKIYSSYNGNEELFDILVTSLDDADYGSKTIVSVYLPDYYYEVETTDLMNFELNQLSVFPRAIYKKLPLVEKFANKSRIGIVEIGETLQNAIDQTYSDEVDNIQDIVNEMLIFRNVALGKNQEEEAEFIRTAKKNGVIVLKDPNPEIEADVKTISTKLDHSDILTLLESMKNELYSCCGVPLATSDTSNGGNKAGALQLGNGWENAYDRLLDEINSFITADYDLLDKMLFICKSVVNSKVNELNASEIEIKYNPNMSDNMLSKSQSYGTYIANGVPPGIAIAWCRLSNDPITQGKMVQAYMDAQKEKAVAQEQQQNNGINIGNNGNI